MANEEILGIERVDVFSKNSTFSKHGKRMKALFTGALTAIGIALITSPAVAQVAEQELLESYGVGIPDVTVPFGMSAFADHNIYAIGIKNG